MVHERIYQKKVHSLLSEPSTIYSTVSGKRLQILSPGIINQFEGPDYKEIGILLEGMVIVGDAEFHKKASDWNLHSHSNDVNYKNVVLHIVFENDAKAIDGTEVLILNEKEINQIELSNSSLIKDLDSMEELQHFALLRVLRKSSEAQKLLNKANLQEAFEIMIRDFLIRYSKRRRRPVYKITNLEQLPAKSKNSRSYAFLNRVANGEDINIADELQTILKSKISEEGSHLRREIILNCVLPLAFCIAGEKERIGLFYWYWSVPALNKYGLLSRKYPNMTQNFLWQQQGMLEFIKNMGRRTNTASESNKNYGFAEILDFYKLGKPSIEDVINS